MRAVRAPRGPATKYRQQLLFLSKKLQTDTKDMLYPVLTATEPEYIADAYATLLEQAIARLRIQYNDLGRIAIRIATEFATGVNRVNRQRFYSAMNSAVGIDLQSLVLNEGVEDVLRLSVRANVSLIRSIPEEYFDQIEQIIYTEIIQGSTAKSMIQQLREVGSKTDNRARVISRDQTSKLSGALNQTRQTNLGIEEYTWQSGDDARVRPTHKENNGKTFRWSSPPPKTGHPGHDIQCRCRAQAIITL